MKQLSLSINTEPDETTVHMMAKFDSAADAIAFHEKAAALCRTFSPRDASPLTHRFSALPRLIGKRS